MAEGHVRRRLAAILAADVVGYSRLMETDETGTLAQLKSIRKELVDPKIEEHGGRVVKTTGDGLLIEFSSAVDAVQHAVEIQRAMIKRNEDVPGDRRMDFRVGINLGDIIIDGDDIHGDGVNIAARLEGLCGPGEVFVSGTVHDQVEGKLASTFDDLGEQTIKNITKPVRVYRARTEAAEDTAQAETGLALPLPDKPSIAVLPFENMSGDPEQDFFVDGVVEDILTTLSRIEYLFVIARNSSFTYKGKAVDVRTVGRELGVRYVVEGSARKSGNRVRVTAQLLDCRDGHHVWADRFDGDLDDVFDLQDRITEEIVTALDVKLTAGEQVRLWRKRSGDLKAYEHFIRGRNLHLEFSRDAHWRAIAELEQSIEISPQYWDAWVFLGYAHNMAARFRWSDDPERSMETAEACVQKALEGDPSLPDAHSLAGAIALSKGEYDQAIEAGRRAVQLGPNNPDCHHVFAMTQCWSGNHRAAVDLEHQALRLNPLGPANSLVELGRAYFHLARYHEAGKALRRVIEQQSRWLAARTLLLAVCVESGDEVEAGKQKSEILTINPKFSIGRYVRLLPYRNEIDLDKLVGALRKAGLPE